jgi:hypothetical protein
MKLNSGVASAIVTVIFCAWLGGVLLFFGGGLLLIWLKLHFFGTFNDWILFSFSIGTILGGLMGYLIYKKFSYKEEVGLLKSDSNCAFYPAKF